MTVYLVLATRVQRSRLTFVGQTAINSADVVRVLEVRLDCQLTMKHHISMTASISFYHLRRLRQLRDRVSPATMEQL